MLKKRSKNGKTTVGKKTVRYAKKTTPTTDAERQLEKAWKRSYENRHPPKG
jgi:hypothetical protein